jgi:MerR family transcriptional regulator, copper efflux regulator
MLIRELARETGVTPHTIRFYEKEGLLDARYIQRSENRYRHYLHEAIERVITIKRLQTAGFTLSEIRGHLMTWDAGDLSVEDQVAIFRQKQAEIRSRIAELEWISEFIDHKISALIMSDSSGEP